MATCEARLNWFQLGCGSKLIELKADIWGGNIGAHICNNCMMAPADAINDAIRLRRSAPQQAQVEFRDRFGVPLAVGDWITEGDEEPARITKLERAECGITRAAVEGRSSYPSNLEIYWRKVNAPGGSADAATREDAEARPSGQAGNPTAQPPGPSLAAFTAAVEAHLLPRLPKHLEVVIDNATLKVGREDDPGKRYAVWVFDGKEQLQMWMFWTQGEPGGYGKRLREMGDDLARMLLTRSARHQPDPPRTEPSWLDGYLARPASERSGR